MGDCSFVIPVPALSEVEGETGIQKLFNLFLLFARLFPNQDRIIKCHLLILVSSSSFIVLRFSRFLSKWPVRPSLNLQRQ